MERQPFVDLVGQTFGKLTVLEYAGTNDESQRLWRCSCACGKNDNVIVCTSKLKDNLKRSCGCMQRKTRANLIGEIFGKLTVIDFAGIDNNKQATWLCKCSCEKQTEVVVTTGNLQAGYRKSCGCIKSVGKPCQDEYDIIGKVFGQLTVIERIDNGGKFWCECKCGNKVKVRGWHLINNKRVSCGKHRNRKDIEGQVFGRLTVKKYLRTPDKKTAVWECDCECGNTCEVSLTLLLTGQTTSCGCWRVDRLYKGHEGLSQSHWGRVERRCKIENIPLEIDIKFAWDLLVKQNFRCALTNRELILCKQHKYSQLTTASLDRIDSLKGYTKDNVQWVHVDANFSKQELEEQKYIDLCCDVADNYRNKQKSKGILEPHEINWI